MSGGDQHGVLKERMAAGKLQVRRLQAADYHKGYFPLLGQLTVVDPIDEDKFRARLADIEGSPHYCCLVIEDLEVQQVIAAGSVLIELKFIRGCGKVGHIEDIVVSDTYRGLKLGQRVIEKLLQFSQSQGCYKVILDCNKSNVAFYEKCGLVLKDVQMVKYF